MILFYFFTPTIDKEPKNNELKAVPGTPLQLGRLNTSAKLIEVNITQDGKLVNSSEVKNSLRMAEGSTSPVSAQERAATLPASGEGKEAAGGLERVEYTDGPNGEVMKNGMVQVARISTFAAENNREIIRRLQAQSDFFKGMTVADALAQFRYAEQNGLVERGDGWLAVYHDANDTDTISKAQQLERLRHSLGIETQNSRLAQKVEGYEQLTRQQDVKIRQLQRMLSQAGVRVYADGNKVRNFASGLLRDYGAQRIQAGNWQSKKPITDRHYSPQSLNPQPEQRHSRPSLRKSGCGLERKRK